MEDSLQLPDDTEYINMQNLLSPQPLLKDSRENTPPHSLAYSNSTCVKDKMGDIQMRSPLGFQPNGQYSPTRTGIIKVNNENNPINNQRTVSNSPQKMELERVESDRSRLRTKVQNKKTNMNEKLVLGKGASFITKNSPQNEIKRSVEVKQSDFQGEQQRKTVAKNQSSKLAARMKELQQALHIETVISQELRTKLAVTNKLLQTKLKDNGIDYFLNLKNSSRDMKNIDIFIDMTTLQKNLTEKMMIIDRQKSQIKESNLQIQRLKQKKQLQKSPTRKLNEQIQKLLQQKQSLINYIDEQKATLKRKIDYIIQLQSEINRMGDKQSHYTTIQRPKMVNQLSLMQQENRKLNEELETLKMEINLAEINYREELQAFKIKIEQNRQALINQQSSKKQFKAAFIQKDDEEKQILIKELDLLKRQRDHYMNQYRKRSSQSAKLYTLQIKLATLQRKKLREHNED